MIWNIDPTHSHVSFAIRVLGVTTTRGRFHALRGQLSLDEQHPASSWVEAEVDAASIDTRNRLRDAHLRSDAFFDSVGEFKNQDHFEAELAVFRT